MAKRISSKNEGQLFHLNFAGKYDMADVKLLKVWEENGEERALFSENGFEWEAYRFNNRWSYGSGAERLSVIS